ncbi:MAG: transglutaminase domain-containing protein, partial [bacterium]|nr:transglutaminase domain-containing protein [bacterium]
MEVEVEISAVSGAFVLPVPTGHRVDPGSVSMSDHPLTQLRLSEMGEPTLRFDGAAQGALKYRTGPASAELKSPHRERLLALPPLMKLPEELEHIIAETTKLETPTERIAALTELVKKRLLYDQSTTTAQAYTQFLTKSPRAGWLDFVFTYGRGDCDVKNTALVVLLRRIGVPARLAIGVVGQGGRARPGMHAWVEYYDDSWREADATGGTEETRVVSPEVPLESIPNQVPRRLEPTLQAPPEQGQWRSSNPWLRKAALVAGGVALTAAVIALLLLFTGQTRREIFAE